MPEKNGHRVPYAWVWLWHTRLCHIIRTSWHHAPAPGARPPPRASAPIGVNLSPQRVPNLRFSFSPGMGEAAVHIGVGAQKAIDREGHR